MNAHLTSIAEKASDGFYRTAFWLLLSFCLGNGVSFLIFGIHTASKTDLQDATAASSAEYKLLDARVGLVESSVTRLTAQLQIQKLITQ